MQYPEFQVPEDGELLSTFGISPELPDPENSARIIHIPVRPDEEVSVSYDITGRSLRLQYNKNGVNVVDVFREGATRFSIENIRGRTALRLTFDSNGWSSEITVQIWPTIQIEDSLLLR